ncbi:MAG: FkbM family methyltransferase [Anaerolineaceae bacterium]|nr:FkbM family methyltransferase [Anaerolineaceae bacterium]MBN2676443.1 FkbM family methyltransferase [Anaerolineaceae bacterium]
MAKHWYYLKSILEIITGFKNPWQILRVFLSCSDLGPMRVTLRQPSITMNVRGKMDIWSIKETFIDRFYTKYGCESRDEWTVVDIGAAIGEFCIYIAAAHPTSRIFAYEPFLDSVRLLKENLAINGIKNVIVHPLAVWNSMTTLTLDLSQSEPLKITSTYTDGMGGDHQRVQAVSLADVLKINHLESVDLMKMDCEGAEFDILLGSDTKTVKAFKRIVMEYHEEAGERHHSRLVSALEQMGYHVSVRANVVHPEIGYLYAELPG